MRGDPHVQFSAGSKVRFWKIEKTFSHGTTSLSVTQEYLALQNGPCSRMNMRQIFESSVRLVGDLLKKHYRIAPLSSVFAFLCSMITKLTVLET